MPLIVSVVDGAADMTAASLAHDGQEYAGPVFDVPPAVAAELCARPGFRIADPEEAAKAAPVEKPKAAPRARARKAD